jgi:hypothetical protein
MNNGAIKDTVHTNLSRPGKLGDPRQFLLMGFQLKRIMAAGVGILTSDQIFLFERFLRSFAIFQFGISGKIMFELPGSEIPSGLGTTGFWLDANAANPVAYAHNNGIPLAGSYYTIRIPPVASKMFHATEANRSGYLVIDSGTPIICRIRFEPAYTVPANENYTLQVRLVGVQLKSIG